MELTPEQQILFNLLKLSLWPGQNKEDLLSGFVQVKWEEVISFASRQGVIAVSYDGLNSTELLAAVPRMQKIGWELSVGFLEAREKRQREVIRELVSIFYKNGIELLLLKGIGLGENYPLPSHRECGDIDILHNNFAIIRSVECPNQVEQRRLARTGRSDNGNFLSSFYL